jgi:spermidine/putrescine transport system permease protein
MTTATETLARPARLGVGMRAWRFVARHALTAYAFLVVAYLMLPIAIVILFSFNRPTGQFNYVWHKFTFGNWIHWNSVLGIQSAVQTSLEVAALATVVATALGTLIAMALVRHRFVGRGVTNLVVFLPMSTPEIVMGSSLLTLFLNDRNTIQLGFWTIFIAHVMFIISFVVVTVKARLIGFDRHLEEAAMDLGANEWVTFQKVTLPLLAPALLAAALLGFSLSIDDFVITYLNAGATQTFPIFVWGISRVAVPPQVNVVASALFLVAIAIGLGNVLWQYRDAKRRRAGSAPGDA